MSHTALLSRSSSSRGADPEPQPFVPGGALLSTRPRRGLCQNVAAAPSEERPRVVERQAAAEAGKRPFLQYTAARVWSWYRQVAIGVEDTKVGKCASSPRQLTRPVSSGKSQFVRWHASPGCRDPNVIPLRVGGQIGPVLRLAAAISVSREVGVR